MGILQSLFFFSRCDVAGVKDGDEPRSFVTLYELAALVSHDFLNGVLMLQSIVMSKRILLPLPHICYCSSLTPTCLPKTAFEFKLEVFSSPGRLPDILRTFGHPSEELLFLVNDEIECFKRQGDDYWFTKKVSLHLYCYCLGW